MRKENDLPSSIEAEKAVLGSIILEPTLWDSLSVEVDESDFIANEHKLISNRYNFLDKYQLIGKLKRFYFRFRRAFWYFKRGNLINRLKQSTKIKIIKKASF